VSFGMVFSERAHPSHNRAGSGKTHCHKENHLRAVACQTRNRNRVGTRTIVRTSDGGATWTLQGSTSSVDVRGVSFVDSNTDCRGWRRDPSRLLPPSLSARRMAVPLDAPTKRTSIPLNAVFFVDANTGTAVGGRPKWGEAQSFCGPSTAAATWTPQQFGVRAFNGVYFVDANTGTMVGDAGHHETHRRRRYLEDPSQRTTNSLLGVSCVDANTCTCRSSGTILGTTAVAPPDAQYSGTSLLSVASRS